jgi:hypothetical protein
MIDYSHATVPCYLCGEPFEPDPEKLKAWAESGAAFQPDDWECPECAAEWDFLDDDEDDDDWEFVDDEDWDDSHCPDCGLPWEDCDCDLGPLGVPVEDDNGVIDSVTDAQIEDGEGRPDDDPPDLPF